MKVDEYLMELNDANTKDLVTDLVSVAREILRWTKFAGIQQLRSVLERNLITPEMKMVYNLSDGTRGTREVAELAGVGSNKTVAGYWTKWKVLGIVEPSPRFKGRYQRIMSLEEIGIQTPQSPITAEPKLTQRLGEAVTTEDEANAR